MSIAILSPLPGDTVQTPVTITTAYDFGTGSYTITKTVTNGSAPYTTATLTGNGLVSASISTTAIGAATATSTPTGGGSANSVSFTVGTTSSPPPIIIETILPPPPPPPPPPPAHAYGLVRGPDPDAGRKKYNAKGSIKGTGITQVEYRVLEIDLTTLSWNVVVGYTAANVAGNNWIANGIEFTPRARCQYALQARGRTATGVSGQFTMAIKL